MSKYILDIYIRFILIDNSEFVIIIINMIVIFEKEKVYL